MILWTSRLYYGDRIKKKKEKVIASINNGEAIFDVFCIAFASNPDNLFDIMDANTLLFPYYKKFEVQIVGLARGKKEAIELAHDMLMEVYHKTGAFDVRTYFT